jgi:hypothetical protein
MEKTGMKEAIISAIESLVATDSSVSDEDRHNILAICRNGFSRRDLIRRDEVLELLGVSAPTLMSYLFIRQQVLCFLYHGETAV